MFLSLLLSSVFLTRFVSLIFVAGVPEESPKVVPASGAVVEAGVVPAVAAVAVDIAIVKVVVVVIPASGAVVKTGIVSSAVAGVAVDTVVEVVVVVVVPASGTVVEASVVSSAATRVTVDVIVIVVILVVPASGAVVKAGVVPPAVAGVAIDVVVVVPAPVAKEGRVRIVVAAKEVVEQVVQVVGVEGGRLKANKNSRYIL